MSELDELLSGMSAEAAEQADFAELLSARVGLSAADVRSVYGQKVDGRVQRFLSRASGRPAVFPVVAERVFVGSEEVGRSRDFLQAMRVTHVVIVDPHCSPHFEGDLHYWKFSDEDPAASPRELSAELVQVYKYMSNVLDEDPAAVVFVYCRNGGARAAMVAVAFVMLRNNWPCRKALGFLEQLQKRPVRLSHGCLEHLVRLDEQLFGLASVSPADVLLDDADDTDASPASTSYPKLDMSIFYL